MTKDSIDSDPDECEEVPAEKIEMVPRKESYLDRKIASPVGSRSI